MNKLFLSTLILLIGITVSAFAVAQTDAPSQISEETTLQGITFPVAELGNCSSKDECKEYCNDPANMEACIAFAETHGLMNKTEVQRAKKFRTTLERGESPGGCRTPDECEQLCSNIANIETCVAFAEKNGFKDKHVEEGKKIAQYLKTGGQMPGGCTGKESCEAYCSDFSHAEECFAFAKKVGILKNREGREPDEAQMERFMELMKSGQTPGGCTSKDSCEKYCHEEDHFEECLEFGKKAGVMTEDQAMRMKQVGRKGPGGCGSQESCHEFCNNPANQDECFRFAKENGFIKEERIEEAREGFVRLRQGLESAPEEVTACLKSTLGQTIIEDIQTEKLVPGPEIGERVRECFEKFGKKGNPTEIFKNAPPQAIACIKEKVGSDYEDIRKGNVTPEQADTIRGCFQQLRMEEFTKEGMEEGMPREMMGGPSPIDIFRTAPPEIKKCLEEKGITGNTPPSREQMEQAHACFTSMQPQSFPVQRNDGAEKPMMPMPLPQIHQATDENRASLPSKTMVCVKKIVGEEQYQNVLEGRMALDPAMKEQIGACVRGTLPTTPPPSDATRCATLTDPIEQRKCFEMQQAPQPILYYPTPVPLACTTERPAPQEGCYAVCKEGTWHTLCDQMKAPDPMPMPPPTPMGPPPSTSAPIEQLASGLYILYYNLLEAFR